MSFFLSSFYCLLNILKEVSRETIPVYSYFCATVCREMCFFLSLQVIGYCITSCNPIHIQFDFKWNVCLHSNISFLCLTFSFNLKLLSVKLTHGRRERKREREHDFVLVKEVVLSLKYIYIAVLNFHRSSSNSTDKGRKKDELNVFLS